MFLIENGRTSFYQWDVGQRLIVNHAEVTEVHFAHPVASEALRREVYEEDGQRLVDVPDVVLTQPRALMVYGCCAECVHAEAVFRVVAREKPTDYIYTEEERREYDALRAQVYAMCPPFEQSGAAVTCHPVVGYPPRVVSGIEAVQEGSGDPSPENVRLVTGHSAVNLTRSGKNLFDNNVEKIRDYTFPASSGDLITRAGYEIPLPRGKYSASGTRVGTTEAVYVYTYLVQGNTYVANKGIIMGTEERQIVIDVPYDGCRLFIVDGSGAGVEHAKTIFGKVECLLECGETSTEFEPYRGETYTADLSDTVYSGSFDWERGVLTVTHGVIALTGTEGFALNKAGHFFWEHGLPNASSENGNNVCSHFIHDPDDAYQAVRADCISMGKSRIWIYAPRFATLSELKAYLSAQYAAGTPVTVVYRLTEPYEVQLTGAVIAGAEGENVLMSSTGGTTVSGRSDPVWRFAELTARVAALETAAVTE